MSNVRGSFDPLIFNFLIFAVTLFALTLYVLGFFFSAVFHKASLKGGEKNGWYEDDCNTGA